MLKIKLKIYKNITIMIHSETWKEEKKNLYIIGNINNLFSGN
jgi:hypothetical protein